MTNTSFTPNTKNDLTLKSFVATFFDEAGVKVGEVSWANCSDKRHAEAKAGAVLSKMTEADYYEVKEIK